MMVAGKNPATQSVCPFKSFLVLNIFQTQALKKPGFFVLKYYLSIHKIQGSPNLPALHLLLGLRKVPLTSIFLRKEEKTKGEGRYENA